MTFAERLMQSYVTDTAPLEEIVFVKGKVAVVTGGTSGLGFCVAQRLCQGGAKVVIAGHTEAKGEAAAKLLRDAGYEVTFCRADMRSEADVERLVAFAAETYGSLDIMVTAGGVWSFAHVYDMPEDEFVKTLDINLVGAFRCAKHASRYMIEHKVKGKIVLISSNVAFRSFPIFGGYPNYAASKGGVVSMTYELAKELKRFDITVNSVAPGAMMTPGNTANGPVASLTEDQQMEIMTEMCLMAGDEVPSPDSVATMVYAMCTRMADGMTGECVVVDNGMTKDIKKKQIAVEEYPPEED